MQIVHLRAGDRLPELVVECFDADGPADVSGASAVAFYMESMTGTTVVNGTAGSVAGQNKLRYAWGASDTTTPGVYRAWFQVTVGGLKWSFPNRARDGELSVIIAEGT